MKAKFGRRLLVLSALASGCRPLGAPFRPKTTNVKGRILLAETPVPFGFVTLVPAGATVGDLTIAPIGADGTFLARETPVGRVQARFSFPEQKLATLLATHRQWAPIVLPRLRNLTGIASAVEWQIHADRENDITFDLALSPLAKGV